jgi:aryl-alcohol dehydrogenase-like predicted oxidoreductase
VKSYGPGMEHSKLGKSGLPVSRLCLGTMTFGGQCNEAQSFAICDAAAEAGITFLDTADMYPNTSGTEPGGTEVILGRWLAGRRDDFIVATKGFAPAGPHAWNRGNSAKHLIEAIEASLRRLDTDYIDLYQLHFDDRAVPLEETIQTLEDQIRAGKIRYLGCSNFRPWRLAKALAMSDSLGARRFVSIQPRYNLLYREIERDLLPLCGEEGIGVIPYNPLAGGFLSGKHTPTDSAEGTRFGGGESGDRYRERYWHNDEFGTVEALRPLAAEADVSLAQLAIGWTLANPGITSAIVGATRPEQLDAAVAALESPLDADLVQTLNDMTHDFRLSHAPR